MLYSNLFRTPLALVAFCLVCLALLAGCNQGAAPAASQGDSTQTATSQGDSDSAAAVLEAYRSYGGDIANLTAASTFASTDVADVVGTIPAYDLTGGNPPCAGFVQAVPSLVFSLADAVAGVQVNFTGNQPTSLIVVQEGEDIVCAEDSAPTMTPSVFLAKPPAGRYGVWVGRVNMDEPVQGKLTASITP
jgi:hypothetical protein